MTTYIKSDTAGSSHVITGSGTSNILSLSLGQLCADERAKLVSAILSDPETAALAKLGLRVASPAQQTASSFVTAASSRNKGWWNARNFVTGACASFALLAVFSFSGRSVQNVESGLVALNQVQNSDHFGAPGSFEGNAGLSRLEVVDSFGSGGFEAD